jgi:hypothetical protein
MIFSTNRNAQTPEFANVLSNATQWLNNDAKTNAAYYLGRGGVKLEEDVYNALVFASEKTNFRNTIKWVEGTKNFPDIVADGYFGVEVKSTTKNKWKSTGGSINESSRVSSVERIFLTFGKLADPVEFKSRPYEDCLANIARTHLPRYLIDMDLEQGSTVFNKMGKGDYNIFRKSAVVLYEEYIRDNLIDGQIMFGKRGDEDEDVVFLPDKIKMWSTLDTEEKDKYLSTSMILFPEVFSGSTKKYATTVLWLASNFGIVSSCMRDDYSAKGKTAVPGLEEHGDLPRILKNAYDRKQLIIEKLYELSESELLSAWKNSNTSSIEDDRLTQWLGLIPENAKLNKKEYPMREYVKLIFLKG